MTDNSLLRKVGVHLRDRQLQRILANVVAILAIAVYVQARTGDFFLVRNLESLCVQIVVIVIIASAETLVMVAGQIDVSVAGVVAFTGIIAGLLSRSGMPLVPAFVFATLTGLGIGVVNSILVVYVGITSLIATIATLYVATGVANLLTNGVPIGGLPLDFSFIGNGFVLGIPVSVPIIIVFVALFAAIQKWTVLGRHVVAAGSNSPAAFLNGVNIRRTVTACFMLSGAAAGLGGVIYASRIGAPVPVVDNDLLFQVIGACVVGGTSLFGGEGSVFGTFVGAVLIGAVNDGLNLLGVSTYWQDIALGIILVLAVGLDVGLRRSSFTRVWRKLAGPHRHQSVGSNRASKPTVAPASGPSDTVGGRALAGVPAEAEK